MAVKRTNAEMLELLDGGRAIDAAVKRAIRRVVSELKTKKAADEARSSTSRAGTSAKAAVRTKKKVGKSGPRARRSPR